MMNHQLDVTALTRDELEAAVEARVAAAVAAAEARVAARVEARVAAERDRQKKRADRAEAERDRAQEMADQQKKKADRRKVERDRAQEMRDRAQEMRDRAQEMRDRAEAERDRAKAERDRAQEMADQQKKRADRRRKKADRRKKKADRRKAERDRAKAERDRAKAERDRANGTYYTTIAQVWNVGEVGFSNADLKAIQRARDEPHLFYTKTFAAATAGEVMRPAFASQRSAYDPANASSLASNEDDSTNAKTRKEKLASIAIDGRDCEWAQVAHLIPHATKCARFYGPLAEAAVGGSLPVDFWYHDRLQVLLHGQYEPDAVTTSSGKKIRITGTGIKHCRTNMIRAAAQAFYLDYNPSLLILPILDLDETLQYTGGKYNVLVACASSSVYTATGLTGDYPLCTADDMQKATATLSYFVKAAAHTLCLATNRQIKKHLTGYDKNTVQGTKKLIEKTKKVKVPVMKTIASSLTTTPTVPVVALPRLAKLTFDQTNDNAHQECDPFLLLVKAAVVWSAIQQQKLLPGCNPPHDCEYCLSQGCYYACQCDVDEPNMIIPKEICYVPNCPNTKTNEGEEVLKKTNEK